MTTDHCAKFTDSLLPKADRLLTGALRMKMGRRVLDPFAGTGKGVEYLRRQWWDAIGVELEPEWASQSEHVIVGNALHLPFGDGTFDAVFTSPAYGNRMADKDMRESVAGTYAKSLGRHASEGSSCHLQWGPTYRKFHEDAWAEVRRVLRVGGFFLLNIKDHVRGGEIQRVSSWHVHAICDLGFMFMGSEPVPCPGLRNGQNGEARVDHEDLILFRLGGMKLS